MKTLILVAAGLLSQAAPAAPDASFCVRMAGQLGMNPVKPVGGKPAYEARALKGLGAALFGGSATVSMMLKPPASGGIGDPERFGTACGAAANGLKCAVSGPAVFEMAVRDRTAATDVLPGERAEVSMAKNRIRCEDR